MSNLTFFNVKLPDKNLNIDWPFYSCDYISNLFLLIKLSEIIVIWIILATQDVLSGNSSLKDK